MPIKKSQEKTYCKYCGAEINQDAQFCKKCGKDFTRENSLIYRINNQINILAVLIGLFVTVIILFSGASYFGVIISNKIDTFLYIFLVLFLMLFLGGLTTGVLGSKNISEGLINGGVLSLITYILLGMMLGVILFISIGITSAIASALSGFSSAAPSAASTTPVTTSNEGIFFIIQLILMIITCFFAGVGGGALGAYIKGVIK